MGRGIGADICVPPGSEPGDAADAALVSIVIAPDGSASLRVVQGDAGVFVNGVPVGREPAPLLHGDRVAIDGSELRFADEGQGGVTQEIPTASDVRTATPSAGVGEARSRGRLVSLTDGREYAVPPEGLTIGRDAGCDVVVAAAKVSRRHARVTQVPGGYELVDTSTNGVLVNGARVRETLALARGDTVKVGNDEFRFYADAEPAAPIRSLQEVPSLQATAAIPAVKRPPSFAPPPPPPPPPSAPAVSQPTPSVIPPTSSTGAARGRRALASLEILNEGPVKGTSFDISTPLAHVGRGEHNDVSIHDESVSESHAKIQRREDAWYIVDMDSTNGTYVSGNRVFGEARVTSGADIRVGGVKMLFRTAGGTQRTSGETRVIVGVRGPDPKRAEQRLKELARGVETPQAPPTRNRAPAWLWLALAALAAISLYLVLQGR
ncbi:MAG: FHA domain-containing protein [Gemmatimonadaceae bacterium]|nr:FHA domain-containing protein [Gemmatimonadaceae bacterium]